VDASADAWDGHVHVTLIVDEQGYVQLRLQAEPAQTEPNASALASAGAAPTGKQEGRGLKPESAQGQLQL